MNILLIVWIGWALVSREKSAQMPPDILKEEVL